MRRLWILVLAFLLLTGCGRGVPSETTQPTTEAVPTEPTGLYLPESGIEQATGGAVKAYPLPENRYTGLEVMGSKLLLLSETELSVLRGEYCEITATLVTGSGLQEDMADISATGIACLDDDSGQVLIWNPQLQESQHIVLPEDREGKPLVSLATGEVFYVSGPEIRALNMETGISRLVKTQSCISQELTGCWFDGTLIGCRMTDEAGNRKNVYISTETGITLYEDQSVYALETAGDRYFAYRLDGQVRQMIFGTREGDAAQCFYPEEQFGKAMVAEALELDGVVTCTAALNGLKLSFYNLETGKRTAQTEIPNVKSPVAVIANDRYVWILAEESKGSGQILCRWDVTGSPSQDPIVYTCPLYTAENPDTGGLAACQARAEQMTDTYDVPIALWQDAVSQAGEWKVTGEYQVPVINSMLNRMETVLARFPENFLRTTVESGWVRVCVVRSLPDGENWAQTWKNGDCYIYLTPYADLEQALLQGIGYGVDSHVLGNSRDFDDWNKLNPPGFAYTGKALEDDRYLSSEERYFVDAASAAYPHADRSSVFSQAMLTGNGKMFESKWMQDKLLRLCQGIREAYDLEKSSEEYPWEQYLQTSLAYKK